MSKIRFPRQDGENNKNSKLTLAQAREVYRRRKAGETLKSIAADFGISKSQVSNIARGKRWRFGS